MGRDAKQVGVERPGRVRGNGPRKRGERAALANWAAGKGRRRWAGLGCCWVLGLGLTFSISISFLFLSYTQTKLNSNSNLNSTLALNQIKDMLQHDATKKFKPMIKF